MIRKRLRFFKIEGESVDDPFIKQLEVAAEAIKADEKWRLKYMQSITRDQDLIELGKSRKEIEIAKKMIERGDSITEIVELVNLPVKEIEKLKEEMSNN